MPLCTYPCYLCGPEGLHGSLSTLLCPGPAFWCSESGWAVWREGEGIASRPLLAEVVATGGWSEQR